MKVYCLIKNETYYIVSESDYNKFNSAAYGTEVNVTELATLSSVEDVGSKCKEEGWELMSFLFLGGLGLDDLDQ